MSRLPKKTYPLYSYKTDSWQHFSFDSPFCEETRKPKGPLFKMRISLPPHHDAQAFAKDLSGFIFCHGDHEAYLDSINVIVWNFKVTSPEQQRGEAEEFLSAQYGSAYPRYALNGQITLYLHANAGNGLIKQLANKIQPFISAKKITKATLMPSDIPIKDCPNISLRLGTIDNVYVDSQRLCDESDYLLEHLSTLINMPTFKFFSAEAKLSPLQVATWHAAELYDSTDSSGKTQIARITKFYLHAHSCLSLNKTIDLMQLAKLTPLTASTEIKLLYNLFDQAICNNKIMKRTLLAARQIHYSRTSPTLSPANNDPNSRARAYKKLEAAFNKHKTTYALAPVLQFKGKTASACKL